MNLRRLVVPSVGFPEASVRTRSGSDGIKAGFIITTVGSLQKVTLRLADQNNTSSFEGKFEIVSLIGTLSQDGVHLHLSVSNNAGKTIGGHLVEGCPIYTTAEIVIGDADGIEFRRERRTE